MKRTERVSIIVKILSDTPGKVYPLQYFCDLFDMAKSSISEDINIANSAMEKAKKGNIETITGARGGVRYVPSMDSQEVSEFLESFCEKLRNSDRILGGNFLYTSDLMFDMEAMNTMASYFASKFKDSGANYVATVETKGVPLATMVAYQLHLPLIICRREAKVSEGSTLSINYFSGSYDRIQKMSLSKRAVKPGMKALIVDDFMRGGGSTKGISDILSEFNVKVVGTAVAIASAVPEKKKISEFTSAVTLYDIDEENRIIKVEPNTVK